LLSIIPASLALVLAIAACGGGDGDSSEVVTSPPPTPESKDFPQANGRTLAQLLESVDGPGPVIAASVSQLEPGRNRFGFALFDRARAQIADVAVVLYVAPAGGGEAIGPIPAEYELLEVKPQFQSRSVDADPDAAKSLYVAQLKLPKPGRYEVIGVARLDDRLVAATPSGGPLVVKREGPLPSVGEPAPVVHTPTLTDVGGDAAQLDTRVPPSTMHDVDFAEAVGTKPVVMLFATAGLCQTRVCGPVIDVTEQVKDARGDEIAFVHMEIYNDNEIDKGFRPQVGAWGLPTEPWVFVVDASGRVAARIEGAFSVDELNAAIDAAIGK
jgi:hypothetical protein